MPLNPYFNFNTLDNTNEQTLVQDLIEECIKIYGMDVYYIPRTLVDLDKLFGESPLSTFDSYYLIEMYFDNPLGYDGQRSAIHPIVGLAVMSQTNFVVSKRRFNQTVIDPNNPTQDMRPKEGDLIYAPFTKDFWEVKFADHETPFFMLGKVNVWRLTVDKFIYSSERMNTGVSELDGLESAYSHDLIIPASDAVADNTGIQSAATPKINITEKDPFTEGNY